MAPRLMRKELEAVRSWGAEPLLAADKDGLRRQWDRAAPELRRWWPAFEDVMAPVTDAMMALAAVQCGDRVVDVASGFGEPALTVARHVGSTGRVVATDLSAAMLQVAAERAHALQLINVEFVQMDAEQPILPAATFDSVLCRLGLMFLPDLNAALQRLGTLLVPSGRFVAAVWGVPGANPWLTHAFQTLSEFLELGVRAPGTPTVFDLGAEGVLDDALVVAGLHDVRRTPVKLEFAWSSPRAFAAFHRASPLARLVADEDPWRRAQAWDAVAAVAAQEWGFGPLTLPGQVVVVSGRR